MNIVPDPDKVARKVAKSGVKKTTGECLIAGLICAAVGGRILYALTNIISHHKKKRNNASANKQKETKTASSCRLEENEVLHTLYMEAMREQTLQIKEVINAKKEIGTNNNNLKAYYEKYE